MAVINIDDAYILDETGEQVDKVTGLFTKDEGTTEEEKEFAQLNIGASGGGGGGGRNLLDNPWFTVNQRSASGRVLSNEYVADRWTVFGGSVTAGTYPTIAPSSNIGQKIAFSIEAGKTYTFSVLLADGTIVSGTKTVTDPNTTISFISNSLVELDYFGGQSPKNIRIYNTSGAALGVKAAKIELGSVSTLANDIPPVYIEELTKCQYYFRVIEISGYFAFGIAAGSAHIQTPLQYAMRARPSVSFTGSIALFGANDLTVSSIVVSAWGPSAICLDFVTTGATSRTPYIVNMTNAKIILSADL